MTYFVLTPKNLSSGFSKLSIQSTRSLSSTGAAFKQTTSTKTIKTQQPVKPKKKQPTQKELEKPKRPASGYNLFIKDKFSTLDKKERISFAEASKAFAEEWKTTSKKSDYLAAAKALRESYLNEVEAWKAKYRKPANGFAKYFAGNYEKPAVFEKGYSAVEMKRIAAKWGQLTEQEKQAWK